MIGVIIIWYLASVLATMAIGAPIAAIVEAGKKHPDYTLIVTCGLLSILVWAVVIHMTPAFLYFVG